MERMVMPMSKKEFRKKLKEKYGEEKVLCINNAYLHNLKNPKKDDVRTLFKAIKKHGFFDYRYEAEMNDLQKQVIPYVVLSTKNSKGETIYFCAKRLAGDSRLTGQMSIAVGGHINPCDMITEIEYPKAIIDSCIVRELLEETTINFEKILDKEYLKVFIDGSTEVSKVHVCLLVEIKLLDDDVAIKETDKLEGVWMTCEEIEQNFDKFESWSQIAINNLW